MGILATFGNAALKALGMGGTSSPAASPAAGAASQPSPGAASAPQQDPNLPPINQGGVSGFLNNPLVQGGLGAYLGAIGSPKREGWGNALAHGGLAGLGTYNQARQLQLQPYLQRASIMQKGAQTYNQIQTGNLHAAQTGQIGPDPVLGGHLETIAGTIQDPTTKQLVLGLADGVRNGRIPSKDAAQAASTMNVDAMKALVAQSQIDLNQAHQGLIAGQTAQLPLHGEVLQSEAGKNAEEAKLAAGHVGLLPAEEGHLAAETAAAEASAKHAGAETAAIPLHTAAATTTAATGAERAATAANTLYQKTEDQAYKDSNSGKGLATRAGELVMGGESRTDFNKAYEASHPRPPTAMPPHATTGEGLPAGSTPLGDGRWKMPDGTIMIPK